MAYQEEAPFHHSLLTTFRKRFTHDSLGTINDAIARLIADTPLTTDEQTRDERADEQGASESPPPQGQLLIDATCVPADITYPTDLNLLNDAREKTEEIIDRLHACRTSPEKKPRTYRQKARQAYLRVAKAKKPGRQKFRRGIGKQLRYLRRNLHTIASLAHEGLLVTLPPQALPPAARHSGTVSAAALDVHAPLPSYRCSLGEHQPATCPAHRARQSRAPG
jgi:IS5 family transposase